MAISVPGIEVPTRRLCWRVRISGGHNPDSAITASTDRAIQRQVVNLAPVTVAVRCASGGYTGGPVTATSAGIRFFDDISGESAAVQEAIGRMVQELRVERAEEESRLAEAKARAVAAVENAIADHQESSSRLAG